MSKKKKTFLNLGCGYNIIPNNKNEDWINIDKYIPAAPDIKNHIQCDIRDVALPDEIADYILMDQVLEHMPFADVPMALYEIRRLLKPGGHAIIIVPDFRSAVTDWASYDWDKSFNAVPYHWFSEVIYGNQTTEGEFHRTPFTAGFLHYILNMVGLRNHQIAFHPKNGEIPKFPGVRDMDPGARLRNAQLVAEVIK